MPRPFCRCVLVAAPAVAVPPDVDRDGLEAHRALVEQRMLEATAEAERLAAGGTRDASAARPHLFGRRGARPAREHDVQNHEG